MKKYYIYDSEELIGSSENKKDAEKFIADLERVFKANGIEVNFKIIRR